MRILLLGEFSGLHTNLKLGLESFGHEVVLLSTGDSFKSIRGDINITSKSKNRYIRAIIIRLKFLYHMSQFRGYDVVQFIETNMLPFSTTFNLMCLKFLKRFNKKVILNCCGGNALVITHSLVNLKYSPFQNEIKEEYYNGSYKVIGYKKLMDTIRLSNQFTGIITTSYMYDETYKKFNNYLGFIPMPTVVPPTTHSNNIIDKIVIFHGVTRPVIKGSKYIIDAMEIIKKKYPEKVTLKIIEKVPYSEYKEMVNECNIFIDQASSYGYGMNALLALSEGKVVLSGCEPGTEKIMETKCPVINIKPETSHIVNQLEYFILNKDKILELGHASYLYVKQNHNHRLVAKKYMENWDQV